MVVLAAVPQAIAHQAHKALERQTKGMQAEVMQVGHSMAVAVAVVLVVLVVLVMVELTPVQVMEEQEEQVLHLLLQERP